MVDRTPDDNPVPSLNHSICQTGHHQNKVNLGTCFFEAPPTMDFDKNHKLFCVKFDLSMP
jgi:hypothetical protein